MEKKFLNYTIYPTLIPVSEKDIYNYQLAAVTKEELIQRIKTLESDTARIPQLQAEMARLMSEVARLQSIENTVLEMQNLLKSGAWTTAEGAFSEYTGNPARNMATEKTVGKKPVHIASSAPQFNESLPLIIGDSVTFGNYHGEPIEWQVLGKRHGRTLLISRYGLDAKAYNTKFEDTNWEICTLRHWLNDDFYRDAFSAEEKKKITRAKLINHKQTKYGIRPGNSTADHVFCLSIEEARTYFADDAARVCVPAEYAEQVRDDGYKHHCRWWLRSPGFYGSNAACVLSDGVIGSDGYCVNYDICLVRPAIWIEHDR